MEGIVLYNCLEMFPSRTRAFLVVSLEIACLVKFLLSKLSDYEHFISGNPHNIAANLYMQLSLQYPILESPLIMTLLTFLCQEVVSFLSPLTAPI
jgi:hypothetical protein